MVFPRKKILSKFILTFVYFILCNFSAQTLKYFSKIFLINFLYIKTLKDGSQKLLKIDPGPFISQSSPDHRPQSRIDFYIMKSLTRHLFSYLWSEIVTIRYVFSNYLRYYLIDHDKSFIISSLTLYCRVSCIQINI